MQRAAIEEQRQNAQENPIAAAIISGTPAQGAAAAAAAASQNNAENLLDIDFDGAAPASLQKEPEGLEGWAETPGRGPSPGALPLAANGTPSGGMDDLIGVFGNSNGGLSGETSGGGGAQDDLMNGFAGLDMSGDGRGQQPQEQGAKKNNEDILGLF